MCRAGRSRNSNSSLQNGLLPSFLIIVRARVSPSSSTSMRYPPGFVVAEEDGRIGVMLSATLGLTGGISLASMTLTNNDFSMRNMSCVPKDGDNVLSSLNASIFGPYNCGTVNARNKTIQTSYSTRDSSDKNIGRNRANADDAVVYWGYMAMQNSLSRTEGSSRWTAHRESWES